MAWLADLIIWWFVIGFGMALMLTAGRDAGPYGTQGERSYFWQAILLGPIAPAALALIVVCAWLLCRDNHGLLPFGEWS